MKTKKLVALVLVAVLAITSVVGTTLAYFTDTDEKTNTFTAGNVQITQNEKDRNGVDFVDGQKLFPIVDDKKDDNGYHLGKNYIDKIVTVTNDGTEPAYVRTHIAFPAALDDGRPGFDPAKNMLHWNGASANDTFGAANWGGDLENDWYWDDELKVDYPTLANGANWNFYTKTVDGVEYNVYVATHKSIVPAGKTTAPNLFGLYLDKDVNYIVEKENGEDVGYYVAKVDGKDYKVAASVLETAKVLVVSEAVQAEGFVDLNGNGSAADEALNKAFGTVGSYNPFA